MLGSSTVFLGKPWPLQLPLWLLPSCYKSTCCYVSSKALTSAGLAAERDTRQFAKAQTRIDECFRWGWYRTQWEDALTAAREVIKRTHLDMHQPSLHIKPPVAFQRFR
jgi:hypothetical protein